MYKRQLEDNEDGIINISNKKNRIDDSLTTTNIFHRSLLAVSLMNQHKLLLSIVMSKDDLLNTIKRYISDLIHHVYDDYRIDYSSINYPYNPWKNNGFIIYTNPNENIYSHGICQLDPFVKYISNELLLNVYLQTGYLLNALVETMNNKTCIIIIIAEPPDGHSTLSYKEIFDNKEEIIYDFKYNCQLLLRSYKIDIFGHN